MCFPQAVRGYVSRAQAEELALDRAAISPIVMEEERKSAGVGVYRLVNNKLKELCVMASIFSVK